jgi:hypothetical protein
MDTSAHPQSDHPAGREGYEPADVNVRGVVIFLCVLVVLAIAVQVAVTFMFHVLSAEVERRDRQTLEHEVVPSVAVSRTYFPPPREQVSPRADLQEFRAREDAELNSYGWIDRTTGVVRIPVSLAVELISERGLPTRVGTNVGGVGPSSLQLQQQRPQQSTSPSMEEGK